VLFLVRQLACKPGFVEDDHLSSSTITHRIKRVSANERIALNVDLLAAGRVYLLHMSPYDAVGSYPTHFTLTPPIEMVEAVLFLWHFPYGYPRLPLTTAIILCCPDFPLAFKGKRPSSELPIGYYTLS